MFDPVHCGHLRALVELRDALALDEVRVVPCGVPGHRATAVAPPDARVAMLRDALADVDRCKVDEREVSRAAPTYTIDTLEALRAELPDAVLCVLLGADAFAGLPTWRRWRELFALAHFAVARRPGHSVELHGELADECAERHCDAAALRASPAGRVVFSDTTQLEISSTHLRRLAAGGRTLRWLVPEAVEARIAQHRWYRNEEWG